MSAVASEKTDPPSSGAVPRHLSRPLPSMSTNLEVLDLVRNPNDDLDASAIVPQTFSGQLKDIGPRSTRSWSHLQQEELDFQRFVTLALDIAATEYQDDPQKDDKIRNVSRGLTRFRVKRESKGIHGRSFQGAFSQFAEIGQEGSMLLSFHLTSFLSFAVTSRTDSIPPKTAFRLKRLCDHLQGTELSLIQNHMVLWTRLEQSLNTKNQAVPDELNDCLEAVWEDALHLICNLQSPTKSLERPVPYQMLQQLWYLSKYLISKAVGRETNDYPKILMSTPLMAPRSEGETFQDLEKNLQAHLSQLQIERHYVESGVGANKGSNFLEDVESTPENVARLCLLYAFQKAAPFHLGSQADTTIQHYTRRMSHMAWSARHHPSKALLHKISKTREELDIMKGVILSQQTAHIDIIEAIDQSLERTHGGKHWHQRSQGYKRPLKGSPVIHTARTAWLKTQKLLDDVKQLEGEGRRLAEQLIESSTNAQTIQLVEIKAEDQSKAVMVFTIVTVIFLPLSFVSSFFGMNTADIRGTQQGQWIFWAVGLSVTFFVAVLALLAAFRGQRWRRRWNEKYVWDHERGLKLQ
ncbi:MAG: hypothetical protein Q9225_001470 [Loekoesia sp. 1 TL-2023]